jgi:UDP-N-acetyl-D-mannosaminuronic acid dehydrogenase
MSFKAESDDIRSSLSYKLKRILRFKAKGVLTTDPHVTVDPELVPLETVLAEADLLIIGTPHRQYHGLSPTVPTVDLFHLLEGSVCV